MNLGLKKLDEERIEAFWDWFARTENSFKLFFQDEALVNKDLLVEAMNNRVLDFGKFSWEIGPLKDNRFYLAISPNGSGELLKHSRQIMSLAPEWEDWAFYPAKPARDWDFTFNMYDTFMFERFIDANAWNFVLKKRPDFLVEIFLEAQNLQTLDEETKLEAANQVVLRTIGEERKINRVAKIHVLEELPASEYPDKVSITTLKSYI